MSNNTEFDNGRNAQRLDDLERQFSTILNRMDTLIPAVARLEVKSGLWGAFGGIVTVALAIGIAVAAKL